MNSPHRFAGWLLIASLSVIGCGSDDSDTAAVCGDGKVQGSEACDEGGANGTSQHCKADCSGMPAKVSIKGDIMPFLAEVKGARVAGGKITVLERPDLAAVTSDAEGHFVIDGLEEGTDATLVFEHPDYHVMQTATVRLGPKGVDPFTIQAVKTSLYDMMLKLFPPFDVENKCVMVTTITRWSGALYVKLRQGEADSKLVASPEVPSDQGPVYFSEQVLPDKNLTATTKDGGALYFNVAPGEYELTASKPGFTFSKVRMKCRPGMIVNAGPPMGVIANVAVADYTGGMGMASDDYVATADALCDKTSECVNSSVGPGTYPAATVAGCKAMFRNMLSYVDAGCDSQAKVRDAWKAFFGCRTQSCENALGDDEVCPTEEAAFVAAMQQYAPCYTGKKQGMD